MARLMFLNFFIVIFIWIVVNLATVKSLPHLPLGQKTIDLMKGHLVCHCDESENVMEKDLDLKATKKIFRDVKHGKAFLEKIKHIPEIEEFKDCSRCNLSYVNCSKELCIERVVTFPLLRNGKSTEATESSQILAKSLAIEMRNSEHFNTTITEKSDGSKYSTMNNSNIDVEITDNQVQLETIDIPVGGYKNYSRMRRQVGCSYPTSMETSAISCRVYPNSIKCVQRCAFGHTLESGIRKDMQCSFKENRWIPSGFKECQPFVDCGITLTSGGSAKCATASIETAPYCNIECMHYEDKSAVSMAQYRCKIDGTWEPPLPFCALSGTGLVLATPPKVQMHTD